MATLRTAPSPRDEDVRRLVAAGLDDAAIAAELGVSASCVRQDRRYLGLLRRGAPAEPVPDARLVELHGAGLDNAAIADRTGLTRRSVQQRLHVLGLRAHPTAEQLASRFSSTTQPRPS